jgi:hypothetical protein
LAGNSIEGDGSSDPAIALWHKWREAHRLTQRLCRRQQGLERQLAETVGFPCVAIQLTDGERVTLSSLRAVHEVFRLAPEDTAARAKAEAEFATHQMRWDIADKAVGYSATLQAEREAADRAENLLEALAATSATSLAGVAAKLDAVLHEGKVWEDGSEFPWPQIRSALEDLIRMSPLLHPDQVFPWEARNGANGGGV